MSDERLDLTERVVVVAGAGGGGIGTAICRVLAEAGASIAAVDNDPERLALTEEAVGDRCLPLVADVREPDDVARAVAEAAALGPLYGLVRLNLQSAFLTTSAVGARLVDQGGGGSIVHIASTSASGLSALPFGAAYSAAKAALLSLTRTAALELGDAGIRVNAVAAGTVRTARNVPDGKAEDSAEDRAAIPLRRRGTPDDIAGAVLFLLSPLAGYITGQVLAVDGGSSAKPSFLDDENLPVFVRDPALRARLRRGTPVY